MNLVNIIAVMVVLFATGALMGSVLVAALEHTAVRALRSIAPAVRVRWLVLLLAVPAILGSSMIVIAFGPCLRNWALGVADGCHDHGGPDFFFCLRTVARDVPLAWVAAAIVLALSAFQAVTGAGSIVKAQAALSLLRRVSRWDAGLGVWVVPGSLAVVAGFPDANIFLGEALAGRVSRPTLDAVLAHEREHVRRRDLRTKLYARAISRLFYAWSSRERLLEELDLAIEQACDAVAAREMRDPLLVARSLVDLATAAALADDWALAFGNASHLEARIRALCEPSWRSSRTMVVAVIALTVGLAVGFTVFDLQLHNVTEAIFGHLLAG